MTSKDVLLLWVKLCELREYTSIGSSSETGGTLCYLDWRAVEQVLQNLALNVAETEDDTQLKMFTAFLESEKK